MKFKWKHGKRAGLPRRTGFTPNATNTTGTWSLGGEEERNIKPGRSTKGQGRTVLFLLLTGKYAWKLQAKNGTREDRGHNRLIKLSGGHQSPIPSRFEQWKTLGLGGTVRRGCRKTEKRGGGGATGRGECQGKKVGSAERLNARSQKNKRIMEVGLGEQGGEHQENVKRKTGDHKTLWGGPHKKRRPSEH